MIDFIINYFNPNKKEIKVNSYKTWFAVGLLIQFIYNIYVFTIKNDIYSYALLSAFISSVIVLLIGWFSNSLVVYIIFKIVLKRMNLSLRELLVNYLPYYITQNLYFIILAWILSFLSMDENIILRIIEVMLSIYTFILFLKRQQVTKG